MARQAQRPTQILVIRRDNIGDLVCTTPLFDALRRRLPQAWIGAFVNTYNAEVLARNPSLDAVYAYEKLKHRREPLARFVMKNLALRKSIRNQKLDYVLLPSPSRESERIARSLGPRWILSSDGGGHEVERAFSLAREFDVTQAPGPMRVFPDATLVENLRAKHLQNRKPVIAVHISARRPAQRWPAERYSELIRELKKDASVLLLWAPGEAADPRHPGDDAMAREIENAAQPVAIPTPDLATLIAALSLADRVICPDGGAMHFAAALGKPVVALFGDSPVERWRPWGVPHRVVRPESRNLADLLPAAVLDAHAALTEVG
jgi:ADP-heptose:LPS heptosyltransferase